MLCPLEMPYLRSYHRYKSHYEANIVPVIWESSVSILPETKGDRPPILCIARSEHQCCERERHCDNI